MVTGHDVMGTSWKQENDIPLMHVSVSGTETHDYTKFKVQVSKSKVQCPKFEGQITIGCV